ncbi:hypothetical protein BH24ACT6_BH24ACT6_20810 [soil metagenome]
MLYPAFGQSKNGCDVADGKVLDVIERNHFSLSGRQGRHERLEVAGGAIRLFSNFGLDVSP